MRLIEQTARQVGRLIGHGASSERRRARRYPRRLEVRIADLDLFSTNITISGMQLACPVLWVPHLRDGWNPRAIEAEVSLRDDERVRVLCELVYLYDYDDEVLVGLSFKAFEKDAGRRWLDYVGHVATTAQRQALAR